jgi:hypothetical protein
MLKIPKIKMLGNGNSRSTLVEKGVGISPMSYNDEYS